MDTQLDMKIICMRLDYVLEDLHIEVYICTVPHHEEKAKFGS